MIAEPAPARKWLRVPDSAVGRAVVALVVTACIAFAVVATGASLVAGHIARRDALAEALRSAHVVGNTVFAPLLPAVMTGSADATRRLDNAVRIRSRDGSLVRVKVWKRDGTVIYSDDHDAIGRKFPLHADVAATIDGQKNSAAISDLKDPENVTENGYQRLIEVYTPLVLDDGTKLAFELYSTDARVLTSEKELRSELVPFALLALLILLITQLPVSVWLVRRVGRAQEERSRLLKNALAASGRERRAIARDLHDGVVPDLAAAGFAAGTLSDTLPSDADATSHRLVGTISDIVQRSVYSLRTLMIDLYPPDLTAAGLNVAVENLTAKLRSAAGITVLVTVALDTDPSPATAATIYRCVRECLENIAKHAHASRSALTLTGDDVTVSLRVQDDGVGLPATGIDRRAEGHFGLQLLRDAVEDLGGHMKVHSSSNGGTSIEIDLPLHASSAADRTGATPAPRRRTRWPRLRPDG